MIEECPVGINNVNGQSPVSISPNPNTGSFTIIAPDLTGRTCIIRDMSGRIVAQQEMNADRQTIDINIAEGVYVMNINGLSPVRFQVLR